MLRNAFNITHPHLKNKYSLRVNGDKLVCTYNEVQATILISHEVDEPVDMFRIADDMINKNYPIRYTSVKLSEDELNSLKLILPPELTIIYHHPILEITYAK